MQFIPFLKKVINKFHLWPKNKQCNICDSKIYDYLPLPGHYLKSFKKYCFPHTQKGAFETINMDRFFCPVCYSMDRERLYAWYFKNNIQLSSNQRLLDFAPSKGLGKWIKENFAVQYISADLFMDGVDVKTDIENMDVFQDNTFDFILCSHILEHVPNDQKAMAEIYRVLRNGGSAIVMAPVLRNFDGIEEDPLCNEVSERWRRFGQDDHIRMYSRKVLVERLRKVGFTIKISSGIDIRQSEIIKYGLPDNISLYVVTK